MILTRTTPAATCLTCDVPAYAVLQAAPDALRAMRQQIEPTVGDPLPASLLKHLDEQTLVALAVVYRAIRIHGLAETSFARWGVVAAPRFLGRASLAASLQRYAAEGAWGISPHIIPHRTLHSVSGTLSLALKIHGPNFGVDGGPAGGAQVLLAAGALLSSGTVPGVWVVLTGWDREPTPAAPTGAAWNGTVQGDSLCGAAVLALSPARPGATGCRLRLWQGRRAPPSKDETDPAPPDATSLSPPPAFGLEAMLETFGSRRPPSARRAWRVSGGWVEWTPAASPDEGER